MYRVQVAFVFDAFIGKLVFFKTSMDGKMLRDSKKNIFMAVEFFVIQSTVIVVIVNDKIQRIITEHCL